MSLNCGVGEDSCNSCKEICCKEILPVHPKGDQSWVFTGRNDAKAETPVLWPPHAKSWLIGKDSDAGRDWGLEEKGTTEDETAGWHHWLDGRESEWSLGAGDGQRGLVCCDSWGCKESDTTERLNWTELTLIFTDVELASPTWWMWVWVNSRSWWWTGRPGVLRFMGSQRVGHDWTTELTDGLRLNFTNVGYGLDNLNVLKK